MLNCLSYFLDFVNFLNFKFFSSVHCFRSVDSTKISLRCNGMPLNGSENKKNVPWLKTKISFGILCMSFKQTGSFFNMPFLNRFANFNFLCPLAGCCRSIGNLPVVSPLFFFTTSRLYFIDWGGRCGVPNVNGAPAGHSCPCPPEAAQTRGRQGEWDQVTEPYYSSSSLAYP